MTGDFLAERPIVLPLGAKTGRFRASAYVATVQLPDVWGAVADRLWNRAVKEAIEPALRDGRGYVITSEPIRPASGDPLRAVWLSEKGRGEEPPMTMLVLEVTVLLADPAQAGPGGMVTPSAIGAMRWRGFPPWSEPLEGQLATLGDAWFQFTGWCWQRVARPGDGDGGERQVLPPEGGSL